MYQTYKQVFSNELMVRRTVDGACIPPDPMNVDYLEYVAWLFDGNTPEEWNPEVTQPDMEEGN
jgi:hypothetical protein